MIVHTRRPKNFFKEYGLESSSYTIIETMKLLGVRIVSTTNKYDKDYIIALSVPEYYDYEFFGKLKKDDICKFLEDKIKNELSSDYNVSVILAHGDKFNKYWTEMDFFDIKYQLRCKSRDEFIHILNNNKPIIVPIRRIKKP